MKNASRLLYIVSAVFAAGFIYETVHTATAYNSSFEAPLGMYILAYSVFYLLPFVICLIAAILLARHAGQEDGVQKVRFKRLKKKNYR